MVTVCYATQIVIEASSTGVSSSGNGFVFGVDDVVQRDGPCPMSGNCDFENGPCMWVNNVNAGPQGQSDLQWLIGDGLNDVAPNSPSVDHTFQTSTGKSPNCTVVKISSARKRHKYFTGVSCPVGQQSRA